MLPLLTPCPIDDPLAKALSAYLDLKNALSTDDGHRSFGLLMFWFSRLAVILRLLTLKWGHHGAQMVYIYNDGPQGNRVMFK